MAERNNVPCNGCTVCCKFELLILHPEKGDNPDDYVTQRIRHPFTGAPVQALKNKPNGDCYYLGEAGCTIHDKAPYLCQHYDCRKMFRTTQERGGRQERKRLIKAGLCSKEKFDAGRDRLHTLEVAPHDR